MSISDHFFGLIQCYSEQGVCYYKDFAFNGGFVTILYFALFGVIFSLIWFFIKSWFGYNRESPVEPEQLLDSVYSQGEAQ